MKKSKQLTEERIGVLLKRWKEEYLRHNPVVPQSEYWEENEQAYTQLKEMVEEHFRMKTMQETEHLIKDPYPIQLKKPTVSRDKEATEIERYTINIKEIIKYVDKNYDASDYMETPPESYDIAGLILGFLRKIGLTVSGLTVSNE